MAAQILVELSDSDRDYGPYYLVAPAGMDADTARTLVDQAVRETRDADAEGYEWDTLVFALKAHNIVPLTEVYTVIDATEVW